MRPEASVVAPPATRPQIEESAEEESGVDSGQLLDYARFAVHALQRHKLLASATICAVLALTAAAAVLLPRTYHVQTKLFAQRNAVMAALSNPSRSVPWDADAPTRAAAETVLRRDNLISLIAQTDLLRQWDLQRPAVRKVSDWMVALVTRHTPTPDDKLDALVARLEDNMVVDAGPVGDGTVTIELRWPNGEMAYRLVQAAQQAFIDARQVAETAAIADSITILERYTASLNNGIRQTMADLDRLQPPAPGARRPSIQAPRAIVADSPLPQLSETLQADSELNRLKTALTQKRGELSQLDQNHQRQLSEAQAKLAQAQAVFTGNHPTLLSAQQAVATLSHEPPQAAAMAAEIEELQAEYDARMADTTDHQIKLELARRSQTASAARTRGPVAEAGSEPAPATPTPNSAQFATVRLRSELNQLQSVLDRTDAARIELAVSQAAFKYRYQVIRPAQIPRSPVFPNLKLLVVAGLLISLMLALVVVIGVDLLSNRIHETWQIERQLGLPVLGVVNAS